MKIRGCTIWILRTLSIPFLFQCYFQDLTLVPWFSCLTIFNWKKKKKKTKNPALWAWAQLPMEKAGGKRLASCLLACWKPPSRSARQRKVLCRPRERKAPCPSAGDSCTFSSHWLSVCARAPNSVNKDGIQGSMCFATLEPPCPPVPSECVSGRLQNLRSSYCSGLLLK